MNKLCENVLYDTVVPISYFDLLIAVAKKHRKKRPSEKIIRLILNANRNIEALPEDYYQIYFSNLSGAPQYAQRVLWELDQVNEDRVAIHSDTIAREINHKLVSNGQKRITRGTIVNAMTANPETFSTIGKTGNWAFTDWGMESADTIQLMLRCFDELKRAATGKEIYELVTQYRDNIPRGSVNTYLSDNENFVRVGRGKYQPNYWKLTSKEKKQHQQFNTKISLEEYVDVIIKIYSDKSEKTIARPDLVKLASEKTGKTEDRVRVVLKKLPMLTLNSDNHYEFNPDIKLKASTSSKLTLRQKIQSEVKHILRHKDKMPLNEVKHHITDKFNCPNQTFYRYIGEMDDVEKVNGTGTQKFVKLKQGDPSIIEDLPEKNDSIYDIAISYAGQNEQVAEEFARRLRNNNIKVFFAPHGQVYLAGGFLYDDLIELYRHRAKKCLIIHSEHYNRSTYTQAERKAAFDKKYHEDSDYIFLVKLDDTLLQNWLSGDFYFQYPKQSLEEIVQIIMGKLTTS